MEYNYIVTNEEGDEQRYKKIDTIAILNGLYPFNSFEELQDKLKLKCNLDLRKIGDVDKREQAIYKRICGIKRPKPKIVKFLVGDLVECIGTSSGCDGDKSYGGGGWKIGHRFTVERISSNIQGDVCWIGVKNGGVYVHHLKLISRGER